MKKATIACGIAATLLAAAFLGAACDDNPTGAGKSFEELSSDRVTEAEWIAACAAENFENVSAEVKLRYKWKGEYEQEIRTGTYLMKCAGEACYLVLKHGRYEGYTYDGELQVEEGDINYWWASDRHGFSVVEGSIMERYLVLTAGVNYEYESDWNWISSNIDWEFSAQAANGNYGDYTGIAAAFSDLYADFTYDEEERGYVMSIDEHREYVIKFQDGKVSGIKNIYNSSYSIETDSLVFYDYGKTTVELPAEFRQKIDEYNALQQ